MILKGRAWKFGDGISTDHIAPSKYFHLRSNLSEYANHVLEGARKDFPTLFVTGDFIVAGRNFGLGSSREHAPAIMKMAGLSAVLAKSFARIFFRNAINVGLPLVICNTDQIAEGDDLEIDLKGGVVRSLPAGADIAFPPLPQVMVNILKDGGLLPHIEKHGRFILD
jgi:3-isopropylmalate/(R)-2-methylmalate dehydratase small subunit